MSLPSDVESPARSESAAPAGYCPHCDHLLMQPGICPECGKDVWLVHLRSLPRRRRLMRWVKAFVLIAVFAGLIVGGRYLYNANYHYRLYGLSTLLRHYEKNPLARAELMRRMRSGNLSDAELLEIIEQTFTIALSFRREEHPVDFPFEFDVRIKPRSGWERSAPFRLYAPTVGRTLEVTGCAIDGVETAFDERYSIQEPDDLHRPSVWTSCKTDPPPVGLHSMTVSGTYAVECADRRAAAVLAGRIPSILPFGVSHTFEMADETCYSLLDCEFSEAMAEEARRNFQLSVGRERNGTLAFQFCAQSMPDDLFLNATILAHRDGVSRIVHEKSKHLKARTGGTTWYVGRIGEYEPDDQFDVSVRFDVRHAFNVDAKRCYPLILEWNGITQESIPDIDSRFSDSWNCRPPFGRPTEIVRELTPADVE